MTTEVKIMVNDNFIPIYRDVDSNRFVEGRHKSPYSIHIKNDQHYFVEAVISVDGLSAIHGEQASHSDRGYIIRPNSTLVVEGWRGSNDHVNRFVFGNISSSYAAKSGQSTSNVGVIGVAIFAEKKKTPYVRQTTNTQREDNMFDLPWQMRLYEPTANPRPNVTASSAARSIQISAGMGTGFGEKITSTVKMTDFNRGSEIDTIAIYYDTRKGLEARGINLKPEPQKLPNPFPASSKFCKPI